VEAYSVLKDPQKRQIYDRKGHFADGDLDDDDDYDDDEDDDDDLYSDEDDYEECNCPFHRHHHHDANFAAFAEMFAIRVRERGIPSFIDLSSQIEWGKKTPRKRVDKWHLFTSTDEGLVWRESVFDADVKSHEINRLSAGTVYSFMMRASNNASGMSECSEIASVTAPGA
jgi:curved DNA-binding protein CbpA